ncbi:MAG: phosphodiester glycosidase family protein [Prevotella sp.]|nr:phosphodiester glycosidase family protein [Prevotella sp.]
MRKALALAFSLLCSVTGFAQGGKMTFDGVESEYEILSDRRIGPGTKYTEYYFNDIGSRHYTMRALVVEIDNENEYTYQSPFMAGYDENQIYHRSTTKEAEFKWQDDHFSTIERRPVASVMSGGFTQDELRPLSVMMEVSGGLVCNGIMHYMPVSNTEHYYVDGEGNVRIGKLKCNPTVVAANAGEYAISNFNRLRSNAPAGITLFANGYGMKGKFQTADLESAKALGTEVVITLDNNTKTICSGKYTGKVTEVKSGSFNTYKEGQVVLASVNGAGEEWLKSLAVGEAITLNLQYYDAQDVPVKLQASVKAFAGYAVKAGVAQSSGAYGYPQDALCLSSDNKKSYYIHLDNKADGDKPSNAPIAIFNQFIQQVPGVYDAILMDGGPSAEMYIRKSQTAGEWVSQSIGRFVPASMMTYSTAKYSNLAFEADFADYSQKLYIGKEYTPDFYYYNRYGDIANPSTSPAVTLSCDPADLGTFSEDGKTFIPAKGGKGYLCATYRNREDRMYIEVSDAVGLRVEPETVVDAESGYSFKAAIYKIGADGSETLVDNSLVTWSTNNSSVVYSCKNGEVILSFPGLAEIYADYEGMRATITVNVIDGIEQIEASAPVSVSVAENVINITADDASVQAMSCQMFTADGKLVGCASANGSSLKVVRHGASSPVIIMLTIDGKKYIYKLI